MEGPAGLAGGSLLWLPTFRPSSQDWLGQTSARGGFCLKCLQLSKECGKQRVEFACVISRDQCEGMCARSSTTQFHLPLFCSCTKTPMVLVVARDIRREDKGWALLGSLVSGHQPVAVLALST